MNFETIIGLEVHLQLLTKSKAFCSCSTKFGERANKNTCPVCLGLPGALPVINQKMIDYAILLGLSTNSSINENIFFARKNYFYPDLAKGYQISQSTSPICENGFLVLSDGIKVGIERIHMEEDTAKSMHEENYVDNKSTYLDFNRAGIPLLEVVTYPELKSAKQAYEYLTKLRQLLLYLKISDANMSQGSLRCDVNISIRKFGEEKLGTKVEIKNLNSFKNIYKAIELESSLQEKALLSGKKIIQQTKVFDKVSSKLTVMRTKEKSNDYRYFPEPDLFHICLSKEIIENQRKNMVEKPEQKNKRFQEEYLISEQDTIILTQSIEFADYFEDACKYANAKIVSNIIQTELLAYLNNEQMEITNCKITSKMIGELASLLEKGTITSKMSKEIFAELINFPQAPKLIVKNKNLQKNSDTSSLEKTIKKVFKENPKQYNEYLAGKVKLYNFFVGMVMKKTKGQADPVVLERILQKELNK